MAKMRGVLIALVCVLSALASAEERELIDTYNLKPIHIEVEPTGPAPVHEPGLRVIGGDEAIPNSVPYQIAMIVNGQGFCGGSIISQQCILTAAHCVDTATSVQIIAGAHNPTINEPTQVRLMASAVIVHSEWSRQTLRNDIAILKVNYIPYNSNILPIRLAEPDSGTFAGKTGTLTGWGRTSDSSNSISRTLQTVQLPIITNLACRVSLNPLVNDQHICTSGQDIRGACNGDSGGPLVVDGTQVGVVSFGSSQCEAGRPTAFARVSHFKEWIRKNCRSL